MPIPLGILAAAGFRPSATGAFDLLESTVLTGSQASVEFTNLTSKYASTYQHLQLRMLLRSSVNTNIVYYRFNGDTGNNYRAHWMQANGNGSVGSGDSGSLNGIFHYSGAASSEPANYYAGVVADILDPFETSKNTTTRTMFARASTVYPEVGIASGLWNNTASLTSVKVEMNASNLIAGCRISLYGLKAA